MLEFNSETLYKETIMDHYKNPRNKGLADGLKTYNIANPVCGDFLNIQVQFNADGKIQKINQTGNGCSISMSSASVMSETLAGLTKTQAIETINNYIQMIMGKDYNPNLNYGDAIYYKGIANFPARFKCASIAWELMLNIIKQNK